MKHTLTHFQSCPHSRNQLNTVLQIFECNSIQTSQYGNSKKTIALWYHPNVLQISFIRIAYQISYSNNSKNTQESKIGKENIDLNISAQRNFFPFGEILIFRLGGNYRDFTNFNEQNF